jgi:hypothetical protein
MVFLLFMIRTIHACFVSGAHLNKTSGRETIIAITSWRDGTHLDHMFSLFIHHLLRLFLLLGRLDPILDLHNLDTLHGRSEAFIKRKFVGWVYFSAFGGLDKDTELAACEGLEGAL